MKKVDFDLTMTILAYNLFSKFALDLKIYSNITAQKLYEKFTRINGDNLKKRDW